MYTIDVDKVDLNVYRVYSFIRYFMSQIFMTVQPQTNSFLQWGGTKVTKEQKLKKL